MPKVSDPVESGGLGGVNIRDARRACAMLIEGAQGSGQPRHVRWWLKRLEANGLAQYQGESGWVLTDAGRDLREERVRERRDHGTNCGLDSCGEQA